MKTMLLLSVLAAVAASTTFAADVNVVGTQSTSAADRTSDIRVASRDTLDRATALLNKNTLATDNNIFIARSNIIFTQNDRLSMRDKVMDALQLGRKQEQAMDMTTATMTKDVLRAVSAADTDSALMSKASAVVAAKDSDASALAKRIADFVDAVGTTEMEQEQSIQSQTPRGVMVLVGTKDLLRQPTGVVNKNVAASDNQITISRSHIMPTQNDQIVLTGNAKVADAILPVAAINVGQVTKAKQQDDEAEESEEALDSEPMYRTMIAYPKDGEADATLTDMDANMKKEQWLGGFGGLGWGLGYRYPLGYWNTFGAGLYGGGCGLGFPFGGFYYC